MPILGIIASSVLKVTNSYESIATVTVGSGGSSTITFSSIPSTYKHLQIRALVKDNRSGVEFDNNYLRYNNDSGSNYYSHQLSGNGSTASAFASGADTAAIYTTAPGGSIGASIFSGVVIDILDYASTNKNKVTRSLHGFDSNSVGTVRLVSSLWSNTAAINRIDLITNISPASTIQEYSSFALYGIKG
jgi:hypothetical protein